MQPWHPQLKEYFHQQIADNAAGTDADKSRDDKTVVVDELCYTCHRARGGFVQFNLNCWIDPMIVHAK